jgi:hypothetical protein
VKLSIKFFNKHPDDLNFRERISLMKLAAYEVTRDPEAQAVFLVDPTKL